MMGGSCHTCKRKTVHGSFVKSMYVTAKTTSNLNVRVEYSSDQPSRAKLIITADDIDRACRRHPCLCKDLSFCYSLMACT